MKNVAITGRMGAGKTTISDYLIERHGYTRVSFAARLKQVAADVYGGGMPIVKGATYPVVSDATGRHEEVTGRELLQRLGQSVKALDRDFWIRWLLQDLDPTGGPYVLDDLRFPYEADALAREDWVIAKVIVDDETRRSRYVSLYGREPSEREMNHPSETGVDAVLANITVDGTWPVADIADDILDMAEGWVSPHVRDERLYA